MYCPTCATQNEADLKFCRSCGQDLTLVSQALAGSGPVMLASQIGKELKEYKELRGQPRVTRAIYFTVIGSALTIFWLVLYFMYASHMSLAQLPVLLLSLLFVGMGVKEFVKYKRSLAPTKRAGDELSPADRQSDSGLSLASHDRPTEIIPPLTGQPSPVLRDFVPSVTEATTKPLEVTKEEGE